MPYVNVKVAGPLTRTQREELASGICAVLKKVANKEPDSTYIVFDEVPRENWSVGDKLLG